MKDLNDLRKKLKPLEPSIDGRAYKPEVERDLDSKAYALFGSGIGKAFLQYLENLTINYVHSTGINPEHLLHLEGQRWVVALMKGRCERGRKLTD